MPYLISLAAGFVVGLLYCLVRVNSPAPPLIALVGLLGIVLGEHAMPVIRAQFSPPAQHAQAVVPTNESSPTTVASDAKRSCE